LGSKLALVYFFVAQEVSAKKRIVRQRILITFILGIASKFFPIKIVVNCNTTLEKLKYKFCFFNENR